MPRRPVQYFVCKCIEECMLVSEKGPDGEPLGISMPISQRTAHLNRVKAEAADRRNAEQASQEAIASELASELAIMTLLDDGPNLDRQPDRLWSSRDDFQCKTSQSPIVNHEPNTSTSVDAIIDGLQRLQIGFDPTLLPFTSSPDIPPLGSGGVTADDTERMTPRPAPQPKRAADRKIAKAHRALDTVEQRVQICLSHFDDSNSQQTLSVSTFLESELLQIQTTFDNVTISDHSINVRKATLRNSLSELRSRVVNLRQIYHLDSDKPLQFNSGQCSVPRTDFLLTSSLQNTISPFLLMIKMSSPR